MKKNIFNRSIFIILFFIAIAGASCKKYLTALPVSSFSTEAAFSNVSNATDAVLGIYQELVDNNGYGIKLIIYYPYDNDEMMGTLSSSATGDNSTKDLRAYNTSPTNANLIGPFNQMYVGIERANVCIKYIPSMAAYTSGSASDQIALKRLYGEALTLRAQFYFELIKNWGDVPAQFAPSGDQPNLNIPKTDRDSIYNHILNDLLTAETLVPWRTEVNRDERITKGAVKALRARIALFRGGYSLRRVSGVMERTADYLTYYKIARDECADLMARRDQHTLNSSYQALFKNYIDAHTLDPTGEVVFEIAMGGGVQITDSKLGFFDGPKVNNLGSAYITPTAPYFYLFDPNDTRRDVTIAPYSVNADGTKVMQTLFNCVEAKFRRDWISNPTIAPTSGSQFFGINVILIRFSDVLLMFAEADNELNNGPNAADITALSEVRTRGFGGNAALIGPIPTTHDAFFKAIYTERSLEFGGEGIRKYDLIRWNLLNQALIDARNNTAAITAGTGAYSNLPQSMYYLTGQQTMVYGNSFYAATPAVAPPGYTKIGWVSAIGAASVTRIAPFFKVNHSELLPIPQAAIDANPLITQDYGY